MKCYDKYMFISIHWEIKRMDYVRNSAHEVISGSNSPP